MKKIALCLLFFTSLISHSQSNYFVIEGGDTIFCKNLSYKLTIQSYLSSINYTDLEGKSWVMEGKKNLADVSTFFIGGGTTDKIPQKAHKPEGYVKWAARVVDGKLKVNYYTNEMTTYSASRGAISSSITKFFLKMPDGTFYDINSSDRKKYIIPYLKSCEAFNAAYKGDFDNSFDHFVKTIQLYNSVCK